MPLAPWRARAFEAAGKRAGICGMGSRKGQSDFSSRQGVYETSRPSFITSGQIGPKLPHKQNSRTAIAKAK